MARTTLTSRDPQPGLGAIVRDVDGREWENTGGEEGSWANWQQTDPTQPDPETWTKVAGNYGPVTLEQPSTIAATSSTLTVAEFVKARLDEDEAVARAATSGPWFIELAGDHGDKHANIEIARWRGYVNTVGFGEDHATATHVARHDPARVLAQCAAMRKIVNAHRAGFPDEDRYAMGWHDLHVYALTWLASIWSDHPDWREEWRA